MTLADSENSVLAIHMQGAFECLSPLLQKAHLGDNTLEGIAQVKRGNWAARFICNAFHFPKEESDVHLRVDCYHTADSMIWNRDFNGLKMQSHFHREGDYLVEYLGPLAMSFQAVEDQGQLEYRFVRTRFWGIPLPNFLSPQIKAGEREVEGRYHFSVQVSMFLIGEVIAYNGELSVAN